MWRLLVRSSTQYQLGYRHWATARTDGSSHRDYPYSGPLSEVEQECTSVFSAFCLNLAVNEFDFGRAAVRVVTTAGRGIVGHMPG